MTVDARRTPTRVLMEGSEALARAAIAAGCRFFAGYPMTPFTEVLEHFARAAARGRRRVHQRRVASSRPSAWRGARSPTGARAATGSTGQGLSLMQESFSEITLAELPLVIFNMARGQQDYYQATRGGGHGDYRHIVLAPQDVARGRRARAARVPPRRQVAQPGARLRRLPPRAHAGGGRRSSRSTFPDAARRRTGRSTARASGTGRVAVGHAARRRASTASPRSGRRARRSTSRRRSPLMEREVRVETGYLDDAETVIVAFGSPAKFVKYAIKQLRADGPPASATCGRSRCGRSPYETVADARRPACARVGSRSSSARAR